MAVALLSGSCTRESLPSEGNSPADGTIAFDAGMSLIEEDATRASTTTDWTFINRTAFNAGEKFHVFGRRTGEGGNTRILGDNGVWVTSSDHDSNPATPVHWSYSPSSYWFWVNTSNFYDFVAAFYPDNDAAPAHRMESSPGVDNPGYMAIEKSYSLASNNYDLLMAGTRRSGVDAANRSNKVPLAFHHMLCAVRVWVTNESEDVAKKVKLNSIKFDNLIQSADVKATVDAVGEAEFSWIDTQRTDAEITVYTNSSDPALAAGGGSYQPGDYTLLIPGDLSVAIDGSLEPDVKDYANPDAYEDALAAYEAKIPHLIINYTPTPPSGVARNREIVLKNVKKSRYGSAEAISEWEMGVKYTYHVVIRLDGDVLVTVITTDWDRFDAETPGLLIDDD